MLSITPVMRLRRVQCSYFVLSSSLFKFNLSVTFLALVDVFVVLSLRLLPVADI